MATRKRPRPEGGDHDVLRRLLHTGRVSETGLAQILKVVREIGDITASSRDSLRKANKVRSSMWPRAHALCCRCVWGFDVLFNFRRLSKTDAEMCFAPRPQSFAVDFLDKAKPRGNFDERFEKVRHVEDVPLVSGGSFSWEFADPGKLLSSALDESPGLRQVFSDAAERCPPTISTPWSLLVGFDEFVPGNKLNFDNRRKMMVLSFSFVELGQAALSQAVVWQTPVCIRTTVIDEVVGGWSHLLAMYLRRHLLGPDGLATSGLPLLLHGDDRPPTLLFARLTNLLSDGDGLRQAYDWKGSSGLKPCFKHFNVFKKDCH
jgi:hypothetical protein